MIYLFTAFYAEAQCVIAHYKLKKDTAHTHFQLFENEELKIRLILTGAGNIAAACAVSGTFGEFPPGKGDFLVNIGSAAADANDPSVRDGEIFLCNKITEQTTGRTFYPDVIYRHPFAEAEIVTQAVPYRGANETQDPENGAGARLYDMEAAAVYQAGAYYFGPHQMSFLKVVTDHGVAGDGVSRAGAVQPDCSSSAGLQNVAFDQPAGATVRDGVVPHISHYVLCNDRLRGGPGDSPIQQRYRVSDNGNVRSALAGRNAGTVT